MVVLETNHGNIKIELFKDKAPISVENFLSYVKGGFYDGTIFHRVVPGFVIQAGGFTQDMKEKPAKAPIKNEAGNGLSNLRGTLSVARTNEINSGTTHFFINLVDNKRLDHTGEEPAKFGYAVFGKVTEGMDVVDKIAAVEITTKGMHQGVPVKPVIITKATLVGAPQPKTEPLPTESKEKKVEERQIGDPDAGSGTK
jgi:cyclophilin family peptidyl-prolyl cis-trans isomerase